jgi:RNA polymerase sigma factor (sigma-70 family)
MTQDDPHPAVDERELVEQARVDIDAFAELYRRYLPRIHAFAWRRTGSTEAAEDVCSATFEAAFRSIDSYQWRKGGIGPWLFRIAGNQTVAHYRREGRPATARGQAAIAHLSERTDQGDLSEMLAEAVPDYEISNLRSALDKLSPRYQQAIALRYLADLDPAEAARAMGLAKPALAVVLSRALKALRRELDRLSEATTMGGDPQ